MNGLRPLNKEDEGPSSPEALFLSAAIDEGIFNPDKYRLTIDDLACWGKVWQLCLDHQEKSGKAPSLGLIRRMFPEFEYTPSVSCEWAAAELHRAAAKRMLRAKASQLITSIREDDLDSAYALFEGVRRHSDVHKPRHSVWDTSNDDDLDVEKIKVPYQTLGRISGGIAPSELWYIAARPGIGKTYTMCDFAAVAVLEGTQVIFASLEMSSHAIKSRIRRVLAGHHPTKSKQLLKLLASKQRDEVNRAVDELRDWCDGSFEVVDPSHGQPTNSFMREQMLECKLLFIDHIGLMWTSDSRKAIEDWRSMAMISNTLRIDTIATGTSVVAAVQLNREGEAGRKPATVDKLSQSDALGQDANVVITMRKQSKRVRWMSAEKVREGPNARWFTVYDPDNSKFHEITEDKAMELIAEDGDEE